MDRLPMGTTHGRDRAPRNGRRDVNPEGVTLRDLLAERADALDRRVNEPAHRAEDRERDIEARWLAAIDAENERAALVPIALDDLAACLDPEEVFADARFVGARIANLKSAGTNPPSDPRRMAEWLMGWKWRQIERLTDFLEAVARTGCLGPARAAEARALIERLSPWTLIAHAPALGFSALRAKPAQLDAR